MPFVQRVVNPKYLSRVSLHDNEGKPKIKDGELEAVTNYTLSSALRQLASVVFIANNIFEGLNKQLEDVTERTTKLRKRINEVEEKVTAFDPKAVTVPEGDLTVFSARRTHFSSSPVLTKGLFTPDTRPDVVKRLYECAGPTPVPVMRHMDRYRRDGTRSSKYFSVTPVLGGPRRKHKQDFDIETRTPAAVTHLRRWTSTEAMGDVTAELDSTHRVTVPDDVDVVDHRLPSPEEQVQAVALKFPAEIVPVDISGKSFNRMSSFRRSLLHMEYEEDSTRRRNKSRRSRGKRRNTIAGTDTKELAAIVGDSSDTNFGKSTPDTMLSSSLGEKKSHLESLKEWGKSRLRLIKNSEPAVRLRERSASRRKVDKEEPTPHSSSGNWSASSESGHSTATSHHPRSSISSGSTCQKHSRRPVMVSTSSSVTSESTITPDDGETCSMYSCDTEGYYTSFHLDSGLKTLREEEPMPALHSTSALSGSRGNNSTLTADSEYELFGKGSTSTTASSAGTVCTTLITPLAPNVPERLGSQLSSSMESSLPERNVKSLNNLNCKDNVLSVKRETSSLKIEKKTQSKNDIKRLNTDQKSNLTKENVSKLKNVEEITVEIHHGAGGNNGPEKCGDSPDSGHNTCSSPVDSIASPSIDLEMSECSDLEGVDRVERIRVKTTINSSRIPSMCVITPPQSDDEISLHALRGPVDIGDYVSIADIRRPVTLSPVLPRDNEYVSLNELPGNDSLERKRRQGARVTLDSEGKVVYSSDSLRRRKTVHTTGTFEPGPNVASSTSPVMQHRIANIRPVINSGSPIMVGRSSSPTPNRIISPTGSLTRQSSRPQSPLVSNGKMSNRNQYSDLNDNSKSLEINRIPLSPVSSNRPISPLVTSSNQRNSNTKIATQQYFPKSSYGRVSPKDSSRPISPLVSPTKSAPNGNNSRPLSPTVFPSLRSMSPKMVVRAKQAARAVSPTSQRGAYVKVQDSPSSPEEDSKNVVKRSDSYRLANDDTKVFNPNLLGRKQYGAGVVAGPSLLTAIHTARTNKGITSSEAPAGNTSKELTQNRNVAQAPITSQMRQSVSAENTPKRQLSNLHSSTPNKSDHQAMDFSVHLSPIHHQRVSTPTPRTAMDLYAIIHESKKKILKMKGRSSPEPVPTTPTNSPNWPKTFPSSQVPNFRRTPSPLHDQININLVGQYQKLNKSPSPNKIDYDQFPTYPDHRYSSLPRLASEESQSSPVRQVLSPSPSKEFPSLDRRSYISSPERSSLASDRLGRLQSTSRNDFKQLLLRANWGTAPSGKTSAVERLKNKVSSSPKKKNSWKSDVLSSTILEDCDEEDEQNDRKSRKNISVSRTPTPPNDTIPKSSALVSQQCKAFDQSRYSPTLETAL